MNSLHHQPAQSPRVWQNKYEMILLRALNSQSVPVVSIYARVIKLLRHSVKHRFLHLFNRSVNRRRSVSSLACTNNCQRMLITPAAVHFFFNISSTSSSVAPLQACKGIFPCLDKNPQASPRASNRHRAKSARLQNSNIRLHAFPPLFNEKSLPFQIK
jgi:hypothetical protein